MPLRFDYPDERQDWTNDMWRNVVVDLVTWAESSNGGQVADGLLKNEEKVGTSFTIADGKHGVRFVTTSSPMVVSLPDVGVLGDGFQCQVWNDSGGDVIISGLGTTDLTLNDGEACNVGEVNGKQYAWLLNTATRLDDTIVDVGWAPSMLGPNLLHWWDARQNVTYDQFSFSISSWVDRASASECTQPTTSLRPFYDPEAHEVRFLNDQRLIIPGFSRAHTEHHWFAFTFRVHWTGMTGSGGQLFAINGTGGTDSRQPNLAYVIPTPTVTANWRNANGSNGTPISVPGGDDVWHVVVGRRVVGGTYVSIDGGTETFLACNPALNLPNIGVETPTGQIGDIAARGIQLGVDSLVLGQRFISAADVARLQGWALWRVGAQAQLPPAHDYFAAPPNVVSVAVEDPDGEDSIAFPGFTFEDWSFSNRGDALNRTGFVSTFDEDFDFTDAISNHITDGAVGAGPFYTPARADTSLAHVRKPTQSDNPYSIDTPSILTISMHQNLSGVWFTGMMQTVNTFGQGFSQHYGYFEARFKLDVGTPVAWPAFWLYATDPEFYGDSQTRAEIDVVEVYATDPTRHHLTVHRHTAQRKQPGHLQAHQSQGDIANMTVAPYTGTWGISNFWDGNFHTYGVKMTASQIIMYLDDKELARKSMYPEADKPCFMIIALQMQDEFISSAVSPAKMYIDWVRAWTVP
jgi:hypothetical protein